MAASTWLTAWCYSKTKTGAKRVIERLKLMKQRVETCLNGDDLIEFVTSTSLLITVPITVTAGSGDNAVEVDYEYSYNVCTKVKTLPVLLKDKTKMYNHEEFKRLKNQLLKELDDAIEDVEQRLM